MCLLCVLKIFLVLCLQIDTWNILSWFMYGSYTLYYKQEMFNPRVANTSQNSPYLNDCKHLDFWKNYEKKSRRQKVFQIMIIVNEKQNFFMSPKTRECWVLMSWILCQKYWCLHTYFELSSLIPSAICVISQFIRIK